MRKICFVTGTRAEYGLLSRLMRLVQEDSNLQLQIIATNMHLSKKFGETYREIENDGFRIDKKIPIIDDTAEDSPISTLKAMSKGLKRFGIAYSELKPDLIAILGDRYEMLSAATAALISRIPIAHLYGGDVTEGAYDDAIRHSITKMSSLHFTSCEEYRKRVIQLGENPDRVFNVGSIGVENIKKIPLMEKEELENSLNFKFNDRTILVTYHPETLGGDSKTGIRELLAAISKYPELRMIFTMPNSDTGHQPIVQAIEEYVKQHPDSSKAFTSLGVKRYLSVLQYVKAVVGNSSSGIVEVPSFGIPTLNIGDRQKGRIASQSVVHCANDRESISKGIEHVLSPEHQVLSANSINPYEKERCAETIYEIISSYDLQNCTNKSFYDLK
ncbi:MAG: UDP-N-acetylglucosamine 2-epimerase (hydrolyzing) [Bacteroidales bacterium]|jgi:UDP-hydrolysing UDP-N-acetyl-D-glucosamine 2-epimerase|nr:UDP-N-acetylglucosamine 2-epimerase (hydrolyzing) [Bacteroidales bacterium]